MREKALSLGQSVRSSASTVRYPHEGRPKFLTCQKFIRPSDCLSGETYRFSFPPVHCTNTARQTTHDKAEIRPDSKNSRTSQNSAQNRTKIAQCMPGLKPGIHRAISVRFPCVSARYQLTLYKKIAHASKAKAHDLCALTIQRPIVERDLCAHIIRVKYSGSQLQGSQNFKIPGSPSGRYSSDFGSPKLI